MSKRNLKLPNQVIPVVMTKDTNVYNYKGPIIIGAHYPVTTIGDEDNYGYVDAPICDGPLRIEFVFEKNEIVGYTMICEKCGLKVELHDTIFKHKRDFFGAVDRWLIDMTGPHRFDSQIYCHRVSIMLLHTIYPGTPVLHHSSVMLALLHSDEMYEHGVMAYSRVTKDLLRITSNASDGVRKILGYKL